MQPGDGMAGALTNQFVVVFGGNTGIGLATAKLVQSEGASVTIIGRDPEKRGLPESRFPVRYGVRPMSGTVMVLCALSLTLVVSTTCLFRLGKAGRPTS
jgi:hypothetical protein